MVVREIPWFYGRSRKNERLIRKMAGFYGRLKETGSNRPPSGAATMAQNPKEKSQILENQRFAICNVPVAGIEPARIAPLVFETSASTDSAIRAGVVRA